MQQRWGRRRWFSVFLAPAVVIGCGTSSLEDEDAGNPFDDDSSVQQAPLDAASLPDGATSDDAGDATLAPDASDSSDSASTPDASDAADASSIPDADAAPFDTGPLGDSGAPVVTVGDPNRVVLLGTIVTPDVTFDGAVLVEGALITCVQPGDACVTTPDAGGATVIDTRGVIAPGMIDTHNHILFDIFDDDDWLPTKAYTNHDQWPSEARYKAMLDVKQCLEDASQGKPTWCPATYDGAGSLKCEMDKFGELKGMIAGTTSIVGLPGTGAACFGSLSRSVDVAENDLGSDAIQTSALFPPSKSSGDGVCTNFTSLKTAAYLVHCGEGTDAKALAEWSTLGTLTSDGGCLYAPQTSITHGTAFTSAELGAMASHGMKLTWSPKSNVALYGATTNIPAALDAHVPVSLAPDWSMGGSQNLLDELRFADAWDNAHFGDRLSAKDLVVMTTKNPADALALSSKIGALAPGMLADLMVVTRKASDPYASILLATPADVRLTMVGGKVLYGDVAIQGAAPQSPGCEALDVCGASKFLCVAESATSDKLNQTFAQIRSALSAAMTDVDSLTTSDGFAFAPLPDLVKCP